MTIDDRLREAAHEARAAVGGLDVPAASRARRAARWRGPLIAVGAAAVVAAVVAGTALLRDGGTAPSTVAPAGPDAPTAPVEETADAVPVIPDDAVRVPIGGASAAAAEAASLAVEQAEGLPPDVIGVVGETVLLTVDRGGGEVCLVAVDVPRVRSACGVGGPLLGYSIRRLPDGTHQAVVSGGLPFGAEIVVVTAGGTRYAQEARDGWVFVPFGADAVPVRIEALAGDGRQVGVLDPDAELQARVMAALRGQVLEWLAELRRNPDPLEQAVLDAQLEALEAPIVAEGEAQSFEALLALGERRLDDIRSEVEARQRPAPDEYPQVIPTRPEVTEALGETTAIAASPPGTVWLTGGRRVIDGAELPALLFQIDAATGQIVATHEAGLPMHHLAAGTGRVWFGRAGDGALPQGAVGYLDLASGELDVVETDLTIADVVPADGSGAAAWVVGGQPGSPVVARVGPGAVPAPLALDFDPALLRTAMGWEGGLLVADDDGTLWRVDAGTETVDRFAEIGTAPFALEAATLPGGEPAVWALVRADPEVRAVLLDSDGEPRAEHLLPNNARSLVTEPGTGAYALTTTGEVWFVDAEQDPVRVATQPPGTAGEGFRGLVRSGTALWLHGGRAGLVWLEMGQ